MNNLFKRAVEFWFPNRTEPIYAHRIILSFTWENFNNALKGYQLGWSTEIKYGYGRDISLPEIINENQNLIDIDIEMEPEDINEQYKLQYRLNSMIEIKNSRVQRSHNLFN